MRKRIPRKKIFPLAVKAVSRFCTEHGSYREISEILHFALYLTQKFSYPLPDEEKQQWEQDFMFWNKTIPADPSLMYCPSLAYSDKELEEWYEKTEKDIQWVF